VKVPCTHGDKIYDLDLLILDVIPII
jgi:hypothetical protein